MELVAAMHYERCSRRIVTGTLLVSASLSCARPAAPTVVPELQRPSASCVLVESPASSPDTLVIALPPPRVGGFSSPELLDANRFEAELTRETLIGVDCTGLIVPGLAESWEVDSATNRWTFTLHHDATLTNGDPLTSREVFAAWHAAELDPALAAVRESLVALDARRVRVVLPGGDPRVLASPELAVLERRASDLPDDSVHASTDGRLAGLSAPSLGRARLGAPAIFFGAIESTLDPRDLIDRGVDVMFTQDPAAARYASSRAGYDVLELPPQRTYAIALPGPGSDNNSTDGDLSELVATLARDVVRVPARPAAGSAWWNERDACQLDIVVPDPGAEPARRRIAFRDDDAVARAIAERIVALASRGDHSVPSELSGEASGGQPITAEALSPGEFLSALRERTFKAYIVSFPTHPIAMCRARQLLASSIPFVLHESEARGGNLVPLVDVGAWAIVRQGTVGLSTAWDGTPILLPPSSGGVP